MNSTIILNGLKLMDPSFVHVHEFHTMGVLAFISLALFFVAIVVIDPDKHFGRFQYKGQRF